MQKPYDIAIAYRIYPKMSKPMAKFPDNKLMFSDFCLKSLKASLGNLKVKMWVLLDKCPEAYEEMFKKYFSEPDLVLLKLDGIGNAATFGLQIKLLDEQQDADLVYFAEDDYFYLPNQFVRLVEFIRAHADAHFVTPYEHPDYYSLDIHRHTPEIRLYGGLKWRTGVATTCTLLTTKTILAQTKPYLNTYNVDKNYDVSIWMSLTKYNVLNPFRILKYLFTHMDFFKMIGRSWLHCWKQILFGKAYKLWNPTPSIATHMEKEFLGPNVDWETIFNESI